MLVLVAGGGIALALVLSGGGGEPSSQPTASLPPAPTLPEHNHAAAPPWGFTASGWSDYCYRKAATPTGYLQQVLPDTQACPAGSARVTGTRQIDITAQAGADADRLGETWASVEPRAPGQPRPPGVPLFNWAPLVERYRAMIRDGIRPVVLAWGSPAWAREPGWDRPGSCGLPTGGCNYPPAPEHLGDWRAFVRGLMVHLPRMRALEIWNEPNSARFFAPHPSPVLYSRLLRAADQAARQVGFKRPIVTGGLAPEKPVNPGKMPPVEFLSQVYRTAGRHAFDGIGAHPYPDGPPWVANMAENLNQLRSVSRRAGDGGKPLWITEVGLGGTPGGGGHFAVPLERQGPVLAQMHDAVSRMGDVRSFIVFNLFDSNPQGGRFGAYGVMSPGLVPKPSYCYLARHLGGTRACPARAP